MARIAGRVIAANLVAASVVYVFLALVAPASTRDEARAGLEQTIFAGYTFAAVGAGYALGRRTFRPVRHWLEEGRTPSDAELATTLAQPMKHAKWVFLLWFAGGAGFAGLHMIPGNAVHFDPAYGLVYGAVTVLGGLAASMLSYLLIDQSLRPVFALALDRTTPVRPQTLGVRQRIVASWALGSGVVFVAIGLTPFGSPEVDAALLYLVPIGLLGGGVIVTAAARSIATRVADLRAALAEVEKGNFDARVEVDDGSEVGLLQAGFNRMTEGLAERERLRRAFGTYFDAEVAEHILREGTSLAGEEVEITALFVDVRGFTGLAESKPAPEVVATINRLFELIVPVVHEHKGHVDKFVGDGMLAVFGAPRRRSDHADLAVAAAVAIARAVEAELRSELEVGVGLSSGVVVAGNVGGGGRFEFSVIGDAVNVAARVEAATRETGDTILISERTKSLLQSPPPLVERPGITLKGKSEPVRLFAVETTERT